MSTIKTKTTLVDVARELFAQKGFDATTMHDIAQVSKKGRRTLYTYFKNKEEIYYAVIETELERMSAQLKEITERDISPDLKLLTLIYTHLRIMKEAVRRNGSLRAEFFRNIWLVEKVRKKFDKKEKLILLQILREGCEKGRFYIEDCVLYTDIIYYSLRGLEIPYIYGRIGEGITSVRSTPLVIDLLRRITGMSRQY